LWQLFLDVVTIPPDLAKAIFPEFFDALEESRRRPVAPASQAE